MKRNIFALLTLILVLGMSANAFAMAKKPNFNTKYGCYQRPTYECKQFGSPWTKVQQPAWDNCAKPIYDYCAVTFP